MPTATYLKHSPRCFEYIYILGAQQFKATLALRNQRQEDCVC